MEEVTTLAPVEQIKTETVKPQHEVIAEALKPFEGKLNEKSAALISADKSKEPDYQIEVIDNRWVPGITYVTEKWNGGKRRTRKHDERYKPSDQWDYQVGDLDVTYKELNIDIHTTIHSDGTLTQDTTASVEKASRAGYGEKPLMEGKIFQYAKAGDISEKFSINKDGVSSISRFWSEDHWLGYDDAYQTTMATQAGDVVKYGVGRHGIMLGYVPLMRVV